MEDKTVLVVEDDELNLKLVRTLLKISKFNILEALDAEKGIHLAREHHPDLILMDVVMPNLNGFQATRQITKNPETSHIPVIILTSKDQETDRVWAERQGASDYLTKPPSESDLLTKISSLLK